MKNIISISLISILLLPSLVSATTTTGYLEIEKIGCHLNDSTCYVYVNESVGPAECNKTSIRWNKDDNVSGKEALSLLTAAHFAGKKVQFNLLDSCYGAYPTFAWYNIGK
ncbi:hypothetical protein [Microbulbifer sp. DLAB2-AA]|uniref:hypothetical protein n=1 Tax=Microbulbifer sp. DLAB2-AA TaxID=3243394 RepID=UPI00403A1E5B